MPIELRSGTTSLDGPAGAIQLIVDAPAEPAQGAPGGLWRGIAVVAHPQPLLGGSARHKIPHLLARALQQAGWLAVRPNFRGIGGSQGDHDSGFGETDDLLVVAAALRARLPGLPLALVGFSFGAFVQWRVARALAERGEPADRVALAGLPTGEVAAGRHYELEGSLPDAMIVHGEHDEEIRLAALLDWARPQSQPIVVVPGADHFFSGRLPVLRSLVLAHLSTRMY
ncbi:MAG TPA: hypothetical protein PK177_12010 [Burkholderiaceae bacterium]|nr:hypothetical protein [Burkholderiaceae bacterium]